MLTLAESKNADLAESRAAVARESCIQITSHRQDGPSHHTGAQLLPCKAVRAFRPSQRACRAHCHLTSDVYLDDTSMDVDDSEDAGFSEDLLCKMAGGIMIVYSTSPGTIANADGSPGMGECADD